MKKRSLLELPDVTLVCVTGVDFIGAKYALWTSQLGISFGCVKLIHGSHDVLEKSNYFKSEPAHNTNLKSIDDYNHYLIYQLWRHVETRFALVVQADGYVINPELWRDEYLNFDYIGAPWPRSRHAYIDPFGNQQRVGNGGFSLRSRRLLQVPLKTDIPFQVNEGDFYNHMGVNLLSEDGNICVHNRHLFVEAGCTFAPFKVALGFSVEKRLLQRGFSQTFGFHKKIPIQSRIRDKQLRKIFKKLEIL
jgi:hypothetical protein